MLTHYQALNVSSTANLTTIKKAYHQISLSFHPDKTLHLPAAERAQREHHFKLANVAFEVLSDPYTREVYDKTLNARQNGYKVQGSDRVARPSGHDNTRSHFGRQHRPPQRSPPRSSVQVPGCLHRAPLSTVRFTASTVGKAPDFHWYHCDVSEREERTRCTYSNWIGWKFSINLTYHFKVVGKPVIPEDPKERYIVVRLPLQRRIKSGPRPPADVIVDLMGTPYSKHTVLSSILIETETSLEVLVELAMVPETAQNYVLGHSLGKWEYKIDHEPLLPAQNLKVTNVMIYPFEPRMAMSPTRGLPTTPYPDGSPMRGLLNLDPNIQIQEVAPELYCTEEKQSDLTRWRLLALGFRWK